MKQLLYVPESRYLKLGGYDNIEEYLTPHMYRKWGLTLKNLISDIINDPDGWKLWREENNISFPIVEGELQIIEVLAKGD